MRILHVVPSYFPAVRYGGPIYAVHGLAKALADRGHEIHVYTTNVDGPGISDVPLAKPVDLDGVTVWYFPTGWGRRLYRSPDMQSALARNVAGFDLVHIHSVFLWPTTAAARAARKHHVPYIMTPHGMLVADLIRRRSRVAKQAWLAAFDSSNLKAASAVHVTSNIEAAEIQALGLKLPKLIQVANGVDLPDLSLRSRSVGKASPERPRRILFLGRVNWKKGLDRLIPALAEIPEAELLVAGDEDAGYREAMVRLAGDIGVGNRVRFLGPVHGERKWELLEDAQVLALPSYSENFGLVVLEAMAVGCPVVVTPEVGLAPIVQEAGAGLVVEGQVKLIAEALNRVLDDPRLARAMGKAGRQIVSERFTWSVIAQQIQGEYRDVIAKSRLTCSS